MTQILKIISFVALLLMTSVTFAETNDCTPITTLPYDITKSGVYCLTGDLKTKRAGGGLIRIKSNDVTVDLNGFTLDGSSAGAMTKAVGIYSFKRSNITVRNGTIRGFHTGIQLFEPNPYLLTHGHLVEGVQVEKSTFNGIHVNGTNNTVRNNNVADTGNSTLPPGLKAYGIQAYGFGVRIIGNDISLVTADSRADAYGMVLGAASSSIVTGNRINNVATARGDSFGIFVSTSDNLLISGNNLINIMSGIHLSSSDNLLIRGNNLINMESGIFYSNSTGKNMDNLTTDVDVPFTGGDEAGIND